MVHEGAQASLGSLGRSARWLSYAERLDTARRERREIERLTLEIPSLDLDDAYAIQAASFALRAVRGETQNGWKMGLTSEAKMAQMGVRSPIRGYLTDSMLLKTTQVPTSQCIHPKAEPEVAFIMGEPLKGQPTADEALRAVEAVCGAIEIIDSRYRNFEFQLPDVVADNGSGAFFALGSVRKPPAHLDLGQLGMVLEVDGIVSQFGSSSAILGHPAKSLAALVALLDQEGLALKAGDIVLAGAATAAVPLKPGSTVVARVQDLGEISLRLG